MVVDHGLMLILFQWKTCLFMEACVEKCIMGWPRLHLSFIRIYSLKLISIEISYQMSRGNRKFTALISSNSQEKLHIKFQHKNINFTAFISNDFQEKLYHISRGKHQMHGIDFQEKLHIKFQEQNINFHSIDRYWLQEKFYIKFQKGNINLTALISNEFKRNLVSYFKMKTLIEFLNNILPHPNPESCLLEFWHVPKQPPCFTSEFANSEVQKYAVH
jgi:hypothetical protein